MAAASRSSKKGAAPALTTAAVNNAALRPILSSSAQKGAAVLRAQILLDRAHFSPGEIDAHYGGNTSAAVAAFNAARKLPGGKVVTAKTWDALNATAGPAIVPYTLNTADVAGPFTPIPEEMTDKAKLPALFFESVAEELGERFHISPILLAALNPRADLSKAGTVLQVPAVSGNELQKIAGVSVRVSKARRTVEAIDATGTIVASYPATMGSAHDPLPLGKWKINGVARNPTFNYNPNLFWDAEPGDKKARLAAGPNNPVGVVWIDLSKDHYGIHGTPVPSTIGKTTSHGCIRLTNWDAAELAGIVSPGTPAVLEK
jgi:lipoprotein-anchoring transpeptidase ErfK/SrfK